MYVPGEWSLDPDGVRRPVIRASAATATGDWEPVDSLVDTGADRTVFHARYLDMLGFEPVDAAGQLSGAGGSFGSVRVPTRLRLTRSDGATVVLNGPFDISTDPQRRTGAFSAETS